jgi:cell division protein FtsN|tara:strand:- start:2643 stop:3173 length:531 start_codon:yes stop_codon:yes gene_type:complete
MLISFAVGVFVMFLLHLKENVPADQQQAKTTQQQPKKSSVEPTFDFYTLLPETEVVVEKPKTIANQPQKPIVSSPPEEISAAPEQTQQAAAEPPADAVSYMIQVGSFKKLEDADGFRARLAFLGIESKVQTVTIDNTDTWHRVQVGPVVGRSKADALQKQLRDNNIDSLLLRAKHG